MLKLSGTVFKMNFEFYSENNLSVQFEQMHAFI